MQDEEPPCDGYYQVGDWWCGEHCNIDGNPNDDIKNCESHCIAQDGNICDIFCSSYNM